MFLSAESKTQKQEIVVQIKLIKLYAKINFFVKIYFNKSIFQFSCMLSITATMISLKFALLIAIYTNINFKVLLWEKYGVSFPLQIISNN